MLRVRFAPSPTGFVHIGSLRTALYDYLLAQKAGGAYVLRVEDTDQSRLVAGAVEGMLEVMEWAGLSHDEGPVLEKGGAITMKGEFGPYIQSQRLPIYLKWIAQIQQRGHAYPCFCSSERLDALRQKQKEQGQDPKYDGCCRALDPAQAARRIEAGEPYVVRMKLPQNHTLQFEDAVRGPISFNTADMDDQVLLKSDGFPTYHFAVVVDDHLMHITHVVRGEEWLSSTPKQVFLYQALGWEVPTFVHLPNILNQDKKKLSKRQGDVAVEDFRKKGYLKEALINYIALVGWAPSDNQEFFTMPELIEQFSLERVSKSGGVFDIDKLNYFNNHYIQQKSPQELLEIAKPILQASGLFEEQEIKGQTEWLLLGIETFQDRLNHLAELPAYLAPFKSDVLPKLGPEAMEFLGLPHMQTLREALLEKISALDEIESAQVPELLKSIQKEQGIKGKNLFMGTRVLVSGACHGPELPLLLALLGKERVLSRLTKGVPLA